GPVALTSANRSGCPPAVTAAEVVDALGEDVSLVIDDGPARFGQASTVLKVEKTGWKMLREGVVRAEEIGPLSARLIVFVCTGNTCRSPMAEVLCKKLLAERLNCEVTELPTR